jgi:hypothetical protein
VYTMSVSSRPSARERWTLTPSRWATQGGPDRVAPGTSCPDDGRRTGCRRPKPRGTAGLLAEPANTSLGHAGGHTTTEGPRGQHPCSHASRALSLILKPRESRACFSTAVNNMRVFPLVRALVPPGGIDPPTRGERKPPRNLRRERLRDRWIRSTLAIHRVGVETVGEAGRFKGQGSAEIGLLMGARGQSRPGEQGAPRPLPPARHALVKSLNASQGCQARLPSDRFLRQAVQRALGQRRGQTWR